MRILLVHNFYQKHGGEDEIFKAYSYLFQGNSHYVISYTKDNSYILNFNIWQKIKFIPTTIFSWKTYRDIRALVKKEKPDLAHVHNVFPLISPSVYKALKDSGIPTVQTFQNFRFLCPNGLFYTNGKICENCKAGNTIHAVFKRCFRRSYILSTLYAFTIGFHRAIGTFKKIDHFIAPTPFVANKYIESGLISSDKISILPNFILEKQETKLFLERKEPYFLYMGRLSEEKGLWTLMKVVKELPEINLKIAGDGPLAPSIVDYIKKKELKNVEYIGFLEVREKWEILAKALAVIVPSQCYEAFPLVTIEAMISGAPVIASSIGSLPYIVEHGKNGFLFNPGDKEDLKVKLRVLWNNPDLAVEMGKTGRKIYESRYTAESHYKELMRIYNMVIEKKSSKK